jgi:hypothetical protein
MEPGPGPSAHAASARITRSVASHLCQLIASMGHPIRRAQPAPAMGLDQARVIVLDVTNWRAH